MVGVTTLRVQAVIKICTDRQNLPDVTKFRGKNKNKKRQP